MDAQALEYLRDVLVGVPDREVSATMERWKASGTPCLWCFLSDAPVYDPEADVVLHAMGSDNPPKRGPGLVLAGCGATR